MVNETTFVLVLGIIAGIGMLAWAASGLLAGKILTKSYGSESGERRYSRYVFRNEEPVWFWTLCAIYGAVGVAVLAVATGLLMR